MVITGFDKVVQGNPNKFRLLTDGRLVYVVISCVVDGKNRFYFIRRYFFPLSDSAAG